MPFRKSEASVEQGHAVQAVEDRSDECYKLLRLLKRPANEARWALLTAMALSLEGGLGSNGTMNRLKVPFHCANGIVMLSQAAVEICKSVRDQSGARSPTLTLRAHGDMLCKYVPDN
jgi:hypothetical protein